jgi:asparagine synthase (glutamine-hydrolysing)
VITDTVYHRQKHPFLAPPAVLNPQQRLSSFVQDTLRGDGLAAIPYFDRRKVIDLLDRVETLDEGRRVVFDQILMILVSACVLHKGFHLTA